MALRGERDSAPSYPIDVHPAAAPPPDPSLEPESLVVTVDTGERMHYLDWSMGRESTLPPLVLIHGLGATAWSWAPVARRLASVTRVLAVDLRGHGLSEAPRDGYELESLAIDVLTILVANDVADESGERAVVVAGHGFGAMVAAAVAAERPAAVVAAALIDGGWEDVGESTGQSSAEFVRAIADPPEVLRSLDRYLADRRDYDPSSWDADQERAARSSVDEKHAGHVSMVLRPHALRATVESMFRYSPMDVLPGLPMPLLFAVAESGSDDDEFARERSLALEDVLRRRQEHGRPDRVVRYAGAGHNLMRYRPAELAADLLALLEDCAR
jgi:pimeloyl-ACP methyl ester carboxylesterase